MSDRIPFNRSLPLGRELEYIQRAISEGQLAGNRQFAGRCQALLEEILGGPKVLLTPSCTHALEMSAILLGVGEGDEVIGMITSTMYQKIGWLGWLYVLEGYRQRGFGEQLMTHAMEHLKSQGAKSIVLEADLKAIGLYKRLGFIEQFRTQHYTLARADFTCGNRRAAQIQPIELNDLPVLADFDRRFFHEQRLSLFRIVFENPNFRGFAASQNEEIVG